ncbi:unnamed protein product [Rotaria sp. Silwood2]|nr:unnamed protein product [Rotaria sp. Silwood2]
MTQSFCSIMNNDQKDSVRRLRCRGSSLFNFHYYSQWQIVFMKHPTGIRKDSLSIDVMNRATTTNTTQLNS